MARGAIEKELWDTLYRLQEKAQEVVKCYLERAVQEKGHYQTSDWTPIPGEEGIQARAHEWVEIEWVEIRQVTLDGREGAPESAPSADTISRNIARRALRALLKEGSK